MFGGKKPLSPEEREKLAKEFDEAQKMMDVGKVWEKKPGQVKYDGEFVKVVEVPMLKTQNAWQIVDILVGKGFTVKSVVEREYWKTSLIILEKAKH